MKLIKFVIIVFLSYPSLVCFSSTCSEGLGVDVYGPIYQNTTWKQDIGTYCVIQNITILEGVTLTIEPGVNVKFFTGNDQKLSLTVEGQLIARGTKDDRIYFTSSKKYPAPGDWKLIEFTDSSVRSKFDDNWNYESGSIFEYVTIEYGGSQYNTFLTTESLMFDNVVFRYNNQRLNFSNATVLLKNSLVEGSYEDYDAAIYCNESATLILSNTSLINNKGYNGGAIRADKSMLTIKNSTFYNNTAPRAGGAIYSYDSELSIDSSEFINSTSAESGGAIYAYKTGLKITNSIFIYNSSNSYNSSGGAIGVYSSSNQNVNISGTSFIANKSYRVSAIDTSNMVLDNCIFTRNISETFSSTLEISDQAEISDTLFILNKSLDGGNIINTKNLIMTNCLVYKNNSEYAIKYETGEISNSTICHNSLDGLYLNGVSTITNNNLFDNYRYDLYNNTPSDIVATNNYWGSSDPSVIFLKIFDKYDNSSKGEVNFGLTTNEFLLDYSGEVNLPSIIDLSASNIVLTSEHPDTTTSVVISNLGDSVLNIGQISEAIPFQIVQDECSNTQLNKSEKCTFDILFEPKVYYNNFVEHIIIPTNSLNSREKTQLKLHGKIISGFEDGDVDYLSWKTDKTNKWFTQTTTKYSGLTAAQSSYNLGFGEESRIFVTAKTFAGQMSFYFKMTRDYGCPLKFKIDGVEQDTWYKVDYWMKVVFDVREGEHLFEWIYKNDYKYADDCYSWIDNVYIPVFVKNTLSIIPSSYNFGSINLGNSVSKSFTITNNSTIVLPIETIIIEGDTSNSFTITNDTCSNKIIQASSTCKFDIIFDPLTVGNNNVNIKVTEQDTDNTTIVPIYGDGILPSIFGKLSVNIGNKNYPISNAIIKIKGTQLTSISDDSGNFVLQISNLNFGSHVLEINAQGIQSQSIAIDYTGNDLNLGIVQISNELSCIADKIDLSTIIYYLKIISGSE